MNRREHVLLWDALFAWREISAGQRRVWATRNKKGWGTAVEQQYDRHEDIINAA